MAWTRRAKRCLVDPRLRIALRSVRFCSVRNPLSIYPVESINRFPSRAGPGYERVGVYVECDEDKIDYSIETLDNVVASLAENYESFSAYLYESQILSEKK